MGLVDILLDKQLVSVVSLSMRVSYVWFFFLAAVALIG